MAAMIRMTSPRTTTVYPQIVTAYQQSVDVPLEMSQRLGRRRRAVERHQLTGSVAALYVDDDGALKRQICRPADKTPEKKREAANQYKSYGKLFTE